MKIILVGATGDIGKAALAELSSRHDIIAERVGRVYAKSVEGFATGKVIIVE